jgi:hypothetical protein
MKESDFRVSVFGFKDNNELWEHILFVVDENIKTTVGVVSDPNCKGEDRIHTAGGLNALLLLKDTLDRLRKEGMDLTHVKESDEDA